MNRFLTTLAALGAALTTTLAVPASAPALLLDAAPEDPFSLSAEALLGPQQTDLYLNVASTGAAPPTELGLVQVKVYGGNGKHLRTETFHDIASPDGSAQITLNGVERHQVLDVKAHAKDGDENNIEAKATVLRRPDLTVRASAPRRVVRTHAFDVTAQVRELGGDVGAEARVSVVEGNTTLASSIVKVGTGDTTTVTLPLKFSTAASHTLDVVVSAAEPGEWDPANNTAQTSVKVARYDFDGAVASDVPEATKVGREILDAGGNAVDAAVAMQFALAVTQPQNVSLGGGATVLVHIEGKGDYALDGREIAPAATDPHQYHPVGGTGFKTNANSSGFIVGVPGSLKVAELLLQQWGTSSLAESLEPAIALAQDGFPVGEGLATATDPGRRCQNVGQPELKALFCNGPGLEPGSVFKQPDLAKSLRMIAERGTDVLYQGEIASAIVEATRRNRVPDGSGVGKMTLADIASYAVGAHEPITVDYHKDYTLMSIGGSSAGGYVALQALRMLDLRRADFPLGDESAGFGSLGPNTAHVMSEAMGLAFADRFYWMGAENIAGARLVETCYLEERANRIALDSVIVRIPRPVGNPFGCGVLRAMEAPSSDGPIAGADGDGMTSHFSVLDKWGNAVSFTTTLTDAFGSGILVPGYGIVLNNALSNFNSFPAEKPGPFPGPSDPGTNDPGPSKRAMGNTAPLIAFRSGEPVLITGSPGGASIPSVVLNVVMNAIDFGMPLQQAVDAPRLWFNLQTMLWNAGVPDATIAHMRALGHLLSGPQPLPNVGGAQSVSIDARTFALTAAKDRLIPDSTVALIAPQ